MTIDERLQRNKHIIPQWTIGEKIGSGSNGKTSVYRITKNNMGFTEHAILKVISIIEEDIGLEQMSDEYREEFIKKRETLRNKASNEVRLMYDMDNCNNVVSYKWSDFGEINEENYLATDLYIIMKEYKDLRHVLKQRRLSNREIVSIGIDICSALEACQKKNIIHRDIKPDNIFYDQEKYLLGDFGISRIVEDGMLAQTNQGTKEFAAPEQFMTNGYDYRVDIYSLGLTLYYLLNNNQLPFKKECATVELMVMKRISLEGPLPDVEGTDERLMEIVRKASSVKPEDRYDSPTEMKNALSFVRHKMILEENGVKLPEQGKVDRYETAESMAKSESSITESALDVRDSYATEPALGNAVIETENKEEAYATEPALKSIAPEVRNEEYATEPALRGIVAEVNNAEKHYETEPALVNSGVSESGAILNQKIVAQKTEEQEDYKIQKHEEQVPSIDVEINGNQAEKEVPNTENIERIIEAALVRGQRDIAMDALATLAEKEDWNVMYYEIAKCFCDEVSITLHVKEAIYWFEKCIEKCTDSWTISLAEFQLGEIYSKGLGIKKNHRIAEKYYTSSAAKGNLYAKKKFVAKKYVK